MPHATSTAPVANMPSQTLTVTSKGVAAVLTGATMNFSVAAMARTEETEAMDAWLAQMEHRANKQQWL